MVSNYTKGFWFGFRKGINRGTIAGLILMVLFFGGRWLIWG